MVILGSSMAFGQQMSLYNKKTVSHLTFTTHINFIPTFDIIVINLKYVLYYSPYFLDK